MSEGRRRLVRAIAAAPFGLGATGLLTACAIPTAPDASGADAWLAGGAPRLALGDRWTYELVNRYNGSVTDRIETTVIEAGPPARLRTVSLSSGRTSEERQPDAWTVLSESTFDRPLAFESPQPLVPPDAAGRSLLTRTHYRTDGHSGRLPWEQWLSIQGVETVTVPAGRFNCLRIVRRIRFQHSQISRLDPERTDVLWYAPDVRRWVQREWTGSYMDTTPTPWLYRNREEWVMYRLVAFTLAG
jgi:hypothetical protein